MFGFPPLVGDLVDVVDEDENNIHDDDGHDNHDGDDKTRWHLIVSPPRVVAPVVRVAPQLNRSFFICVYLSQKSSPMRGNRHHR